jgi:hypothetical protein
MTVLKSQFEEWLKSRPASVQRLAHQFPPGSKLLVDGKEHYVIGWTEDDFLVLSDVHPSENYDASVARKHHMCAAHVRSGETRCEVVQL